MSTSDSPPPGYRLPGFVFLWVVRLLSAAAAGVAIYLLWQTAIVKTMPPGCSVGSGCLDVLISRWATIVGLPVSVGAILVYVLFFAASFLISPRVSVRAQRLGWSALIFLSVVVLASVAWFVSLQAFALKSFCIWCMTDHALGFLAALAVLLRAPWGRAAKFADTPQAGIYHRPRELAVATVLGVLAVAWIAGLQILLPAPPTAVKRLPPGYNEDTGPGADRRLVLLDGEVELRPHELPMVGSADAEKLIVMMFDYCCPSCRQTHASLRLAVDRHPEQLGVVLMPVPLNPECNPYVDAISDPAFQHACELAQLAIAVHTAQPAAFPEFDAWLFQGAEPPSAAAAAEKAIELIGQEALLAARKNPAITQQLTKNIEIFRDTGLDRIPILFSPGIPTIVGRPERDLLSEILEHELKITP